jgi:xanthine/CO dehydrogenase XdhC/CoxF family maturation factor
MAERRRIVRQWHERGARALVTLVRVEGSSYRRPGAHLLVGAEGGYAGSISGGCLEAEVVRKAGWMVRDGARVERYSTMFDDTAEVPFGLGCGGVVDVLVEPAETAECRAYLEAMERALRGEASVVATWLPEDGRRLGRAVFAADGGVVFVSAGLGAADIATLDVTNVETGMVADSGVFVERVDAPQRLIVLGAGDDAAPVVRMAALLGWSVTVADGRVQMARPERFAEAERVAVAQDVAQLNLGPRDAVVIMTHSYEQDRGFLVGLLRDGFGGFLGLLGAAHRSSLLVGEAAAELGRSVAECCARVHAPVGLDLGGDGAEAIALAVVAQVQAWVQGRPDAGRRLTAEFVAEQIAQGGASRYQQAQCAVDTASA